MGDNSTIFSLEVAPEGWFAKETQPHGWFDKDALDPASGGSSGSPYSLAVGTSAVTLTGSTIALRRALKLSVSTAAITATGSSVALRTARKLAVATAAVTATGSTVAIKATRTLAVSTAAVTLTGSSITLTYASPNKRVAVDTAAITLTGGEIALSTTSAPTTEQAYGRGPFSFPKRATYRLDDEEQADDLRKEIVRIGEAAKPVIQTGIIETRRKSRAPNVETLARVAQQRRQAEQARQEQIRRQIAADDEWLMLA